MIKTLNKMSNRELNNIINKISHTSQTGTYVSNVGEICEQVNHDLIIPENQRTVKWTNKKIAQLRTEFIAYLLYTTIKMLGTNGESALELFQKKFPQAKIISAGYYQGIAISYNRKTEKYEMQDGQHRFFHYLIDFIKNECPINRTDFIKNKEVANCIETLFKNCSDPAITFGMLPNEWQRAILNIPVVVNFVDAATPEEAASLFVSQNSSDAIKEYDTHKSNNYTQSGWTRVNYVVDRIKSGKEIILVNKSGKEIRFDADKVQILKAMFPSGKETLTYFLQRNILMLCCNDVNYAWTIHQKQNEVVANYFKFTEKKSANDIDKMLTKVFKCYISVSKYYEDKEDLKVTKRTQSFITGLAYVEGKCKNEFSDKNLYLNSMKAIVEEMICDTTGFASDYNNAHYNFSKPLKVYDHVCDTYNALAAAKSKGVA